MNDYEHEIRKRFALQKEYLGENKPINKVKPLLSVCIQTYNHEKFIRQALDSILNQKTSFTFEVIIGEDDSTDNTRKICIEYSKKYPDKIRLFLRDRSLSHLFDQEGNLVRRLNGIWTRFSAKGDYIALMEGDDYWIDPLKLEKQLNFLINNKEYFFCCHRSHISKDNKLVDVRPKRTVNSVHLENNLMRKTLHTTSLVFKNVKELNDALITYGLNFSTGDFFITLFLASRGPGYLFPEVMGVYRVHPGGVYSPLGEIKKLKMGIQNRRAALEHIPMNFKQKMICRLMIMLRQVKILWLKLKGLFKKG